ncbi:hypothetical protein RCL1_005628 [Eukaryota sp. TZLM3-RCL]
MSPPLTVLFSASGASPLSAIDTKKVRRVYDSDAKGYIFHLEKSTNSELSFPKTGKQVSITDKFLGLVISICETAPFSLELSLSDVSRAKRRLILSTVVSKPSFTPLLGRLPFPGDFAHSAENSLSVSEILRQQSLFTLFIDLDSLCESVFHQSLGFLCGLTVRSTCRIRCAFSSKVAPNIPNHPPSWPVISSLPEPYATLPLIVYSPHEFITISPQSSINQIPQSFMIESRPAPKTTVKINHREERSKSAKPTIAFGTRIAAENRSKSAVEKVKMPTPKPIKNVIQSKSPSLSSHQFVPSHVTTEVSERRVSSRYEQSRPSIKPPINQISSELSRDSLDISDWNSDDATSLLELSKAFSSQVKLPTVQETRVSSSFFEEIIEEDEEVDYQSSRDQSVDDCQSNLIDESSEHYDDEEVEQDGDGDGKFSSGNSSPLSSQEFPTNSLAQTSPFVPAFSSQLPTHYSAQQHDQDNYLVENKDDDEEEDSLYKEEEKVEKEILQQEEGEIFQQEEIEEEEEIEADEEIEEGYKRLVIDHGVDSDLGGDLNDPLEYQELVEFAFIGSEINQDILFNEVIEDKEFIHNSELNETTDSDEFIVHESVPTPSSPPRLTSTFDSLNTPRNGEIYEEEDCIYSHFKSEKYFDPVSGKFLEI